MPRFVEHPSYKATETYDITPHVPKDQATRNNFPFKVALLSSFPVKVCLSLGTAESRIVLMCADDKLPNLPCQTLVVWHVWAFEGQMSHPELTSLIQNFSCCPSFPGIVATDYYIQHNTTISLKRKFCVCTSVTFKQTRVFLIFI